MVGDGPLIPGLTPLPQGGSGAVGGRGVAGDLSQFPPGTLLQGTVVSFDAAGRPIVNAEAIQLVLGTRLPVQQGSRIVVRVEPSQSSSTGISTGGDELKLPPVRILSIDGKSPLTLPAATGDLSGPATTPKGDLAVAGQSAASRALAEVIQSRPLLVDASAAKLSPLQQPSVSQAPLPSTPHAVDTLVASRPQTGQHTAPTPPPSFPATPQAIANSAPQPVPLLLLHPSAVVPTQLPPQAAIPQGVPQVIAQFLQQGGHFEPGVQVQAKVAELVLPQPAPVMATPAPPSASTTTAAPSQPSVPTPAPSLLTTPPTAPVQPQYSAQQPITSPAAIPAANVPAEPAQSSSSRHPSLGAGLSLYQKTLGLSGGVPTPSPLPASPVFTSTPSTTGALPNAATTAPASPNAPTPPSPQSVSSTPSHLPPTSLPQAEQQLLTQIFQQAQGNAEVLRSWLERTDAQFLPRQQMGGVVMGREHDGSLLVQTRVGTLLTAPTAPAQSPAPGTWVRLDVQGVTKPASMPLPMPLQPVTEWGHALSVAQRIAQPDSAFSQLVALLQGPHAASMQGTLDHLLPHSGSTFTTGLLLFMSVVKKGDLNDWLGRDALDWLERMAPHDLLPRLGQEMGSLRHLLTEQPATPWQALFLPVVVDKHLELARLYIKQEEEEKKKKGGGTRFVVEIDLSQLGPMQFDGFIKKQESRSLFDLIVRTVKALTEEMRRDISQIFYQAQEMTGLQGGIQFRVEPEFPVQPLQEIQQALEKPVDTGSTSGSFLA